ncbi:MAG: hypothetical protein MUF07_19545 [Steroidobacteraceae bacterium]|nr:hypothetical protein [Steroidobacteraceae bacterium]
MPPSPRLWALLGAWGAAASFAVATCRPCGAGGRALLFAACLAAAVASLPRLLPGRRGVRALRRAGEHWWLLVADGWCAVELERAVEVLRAGWWLQWRGVPDGRRHWAWVDAGRSARRPYRALCRALQQDAAARGVPPGAGQPPGLPPGTGRGSRRDLPGSS